MNTPQLPSDKAIVPVLVLYFFYVDAQELDFVLINIPPTTIEKEISIVVIFFNKFIKTPPNMSVVQF